MKICVISDTHNQHLEFEMPGNELPEADAIIHCGDFSNSQSQMEYFIRWYSHLPYKYKILIAGNHDIALEEEDFLENFKQLCHTSGVIFLHDSGVDIEGIKIWGAPWSNEFGNWAFMRNDIELDRYWQKIPDDTQVLITHGPAKSMGDKVRQIYGREKSHHVGSTTLRMRLDKLPKLTHHFYGHIHEDFGEHHSGSKFISYNASNWDYYETGIKYPQVFNLTKKEK